MKKTAILLLLLTFLICNKLNGQDNAIGLRLGFSGFEASFQTSQIVPNRLEADFGWGWVNNWFNWNLTGIYQFVFPIENNFYWFAGPGFGIGSWQYRGKVLELKENEGVSLFFVLNTGAEYNFKEVPFQVSLDLRLKPYIVNKGDSRYVDIGVAVRYRF